MTAKLQILAIVSIASITTFAGEIVPDGWISPEQLLQAEDPIQRQLDTGIAMGPTAWDLAAVKDARLLVIYMQLFERLDTQKAKAALRLEQQQWLKTRAKVVEALSDPQGGSMVTVDQASKHMEMTDERISVLSSRLNKGKPQRR